MAMFSQNTIFLLIMIYHGFRRVDCTNLLDEYFLQNGSLGHCGENIDTASSVILRSHVGAGLFGGLNTYTADQECAVTFQTENGSKVHMQFTFFDLQSADGNTCKDKIVVSELGTGSTEVTEFCTKQDFTSKTEKIQVQFISDSTVEKKGFVALLTSFHDGTCGDAEFKCDTDRCISSHLKCDGHKHCLDEEDESKETSGCSILDDVTNNVTSLGKYAVLAIAVVIGGVLFAIFTTAVLWRYLKKDVKCCECSDDDEDDVTSIPVSPLLTDVRKNRVKGPGTSSNKKAAGSSAKQMFVEEVPKGGKSVKNKRKSHHDDEW